MQNIRKPRSFTPRDTFRDKYKLNHFIQSPILFVVDDQGEQLGEMSKSEALKLAEDYGQDLVEIVPNAQPPVAKIISWSKFKYELQKKLKSNKHRSQEQKEIWFKAFIGDGDIEHKLKKVQEFIKDGQRVKLTIRRKGRVSPEQFKELMTKLLERTGEYAEPMAEPKFEGGNYTVVLGPKK